MRFETAQAPDLLVDLAVVPVAGGGLRVVGVGERGAYRFDNPLGPAVPIARGTKARKIGGVDAYPGVAAVWTEHGGESDFIDVETGRWAPVPRGLPSARPLGFVFRNEREGVAFLLGVGLAATTDGGASWRLVRETGEGDAARVQGIRFRDGEVEARDADHRPAIVDVAAATLGPFLGGTRVLDDDTPLRVPPPRGDELPLEYWMRGSEQNPFVLAVDDGGEAPHGMVRVGADGLVALVDIGRARLTDVAAGDNNWSSEATRRPSPGDHPMSALSGGRQATVQGVWDDGGEPHVEVYQRGGIVKHPSVRFPGAHGKISLLCPIEEDKDHALHFVLGDENGAYVVIQRSAAVPAAAIAIPGARYALLHGAHGIAVGPGRALVSADGGATWSDVPPPRGLDEEVAALAASPGTDMVVSAYGARVGNLVRVGWGPAEPPPPGGPPEGVVPVPDGGPEETAPALVCADGRPLEGRAAEAQGRRRPPQGRRRRRAEGARRERGRLGHRRAHRQLRHLNRLRPRRRRARLGGGLARRLRHRRRAAHLDHLGAAVGDRIGLALHARVHGRQGPAGDRLRGTVRCSSGSSRTERTTRRRSPPPSRCRASSASPPPGAARSPGSTDRTSCSGAGGRAPTACSPSPAPP